jgi:hypothetical protein
VDEAGEIIAKATDDHNLSAATTASRWRPNLGKELFWKDTGDRVKRSLFQGKFSSTYSLMRRQRDAAGVWSRRIASMLPVHASDDRGAGLAPFLLALPTHRRRFAGF